MSYPTTVDTGQVQPWLISNEAVAGPSASHTLTANKVYLYAFETMANITIDAMRWAMAATTTGTTDLGIFDASGNLLAHTGTSTNSANVNISANIAKDGAGNTITSLALAPGRYYTGLCPSNSTDTYQAAAFFTGTPLIDHAMIATNAGTAGVLPATTGAIINNTTLVPMVSAHIVGGIA